MYYVYKFLNKSEKVIYVGKTINLDQRIKSHFGSFGHLDQACYDDVKSVCFIELESMTECTIYEIYYINKYNPMFNVRDKYNENPNFTISEKEWKIYDNSFKTISNKKQQDVICLKKHRNKLGYTQNDIAIEIGITDRAYRNLELGKSKPSYEIVLALEDLFQTNHRELFKKDNDLE